MSTPGFAIMSAKAAEPVQLAMQRLTLTGKVLPLGARLWVRHEFESNESNPIEVVYSFAQPREATLRRFRISGEGFSVNSELRPTKEAVETYEAAMRNGSLASLARVYRDAVVNLNVGNIRPKEHVTVLLELACGVELHDDGLRLRFPFTLSPSYHAQARTFEMTPGVGEMELPEEHFGDVILPQYRKSADGLHEVGFALDVDFGGEIREIGSPSHSLRVENTDTGQRVSLARASDVPNRDLVLDVKKKASAIALFSGCDDSGKGRVAAIVPSAEFGTTSNAPRRVVIVLDRSGSMQGVPIEQAKRAIDACLAVLEERDSFSLIAFDNVAEVFRESLTDATSDQRRDARDFLAKIGARGGTHLAPALEAAAKALQGQSGDIMVFTDGQVFATEEILERVRATHTRVHCLGIGAASQDRFLAQMASHTGGISRFMTPNERVDIAALELFAAIGRPIATDVRVTITSTGQARVVPEPQKEVFSGTPLSFFAVVGDAEPAELTITWQNNGVPRTFTSPVRFESAPVANTLKLLQGARLIADLESREAQPLGAAQRREVSRIKDQLCALSEEYGLASREMSLVAVVKRTGDVAGDIPKTQVVDVGMPEGMEMTAYFGTPDLLHAATRRLAAPLSSLKRLDGSDRSALGGRQAGSVESAAAGSFGRSRFATLKCMLGSRGDSHTDAPAETRLMPEDVMVELVSRMEADGGLTGGSSFEERVAKSLVALLCLLAEGNTAATGPFRLHIQKLIRFLNDALTRPDLQHGESVRTTLERINDGKMVAGDWLPFGQQIAQTDQVDVGAFWQRLEEAVSNARSAAS